ncbi:MAG: helix-hairpin-helix domain-containing protein [Candidatus Omnitrophota bacterium]
MKHDFYERFTILVLLIFLFTGAVILFFRDKAPCPEITIEKNGFEEIVTLKQIQKRNIENRKININEAQIDELTVIPYIGNVIASRILDYRKFHGDFRTKEELLCVEGIGKNKLEKMKEYIKLR